MNIIVAFFMAFSVAELLIPFYQERTEMFDLFFNNNQHLIFFINIKILAGPNSEKTVEDWANKIAKNIQLSGKAVNQHLFGRKFPKMLTLKNKTDHHKIK